MGTANNTVVHALYTYEAQQDDELSFQDGDEMTILRKGDEEETLWWWARRNDKEGYVPRNLLGVSILVIFLISMSYSPVGKGFQHTGLVISSAPTWTIAKDGKFL